MDPAGLISRQNAATSDMEREGVCSVPGLDGMDAARALAGLPRGPYLLARVLWVLDQSSLSALENQLWGEMCGVASRKGWTKSKSYPVGKELLRKMAKMAIYETVSPPQCHVCNGRKEIHPKNQAVRPCGACSGTGLKAISNRKRADKVGISETSWRRTWSERYAEFLAKQQAWMQLAHEHVRKKLAAGQNGHGEKSKIN